MAAAPTRPQILPRHVAIIMDGNGRWARKRHLPREAGHVAGVSAVRETVRAACDIGLENLTLFAFSSRELEAAQDRSRRADGPVPRLFPQRLDELVERNVRVRIIGHRGRVAADIQQMIEDAEKRTANNTGLNLTFAFDYGGQEEIAAAARELARAAKEGRLDPETITPELFATRLFTSALPEPDLVIRTSGEHRLSQFPALAIGLCRTAVRRHAVAGFRPRRSCSRRSSSFAQRERRFGAVIRKPWREHSRARIRRRRDHAPGYRGISFNWTGSRGRCSASVLAAIADAAVCSRPQSVSPLVDRDRRVAGGARMAPHGRQRSALSRAETVHDRR